jgi:hypothetical protein
VQAETEISLIEPPAPDSAIRFCRPWGIDDIFGAIIRNPCTRRDLFLKMGESLDKRNSTAHADIATEAIAKELREHQTTVAALCDGAVWAG